MKPPHPFAKAHARYLRDYAWRFAASAPASPAWTKSDGPRCIAVLPLRGETPDALSARLAEAALGQALLVAVVNAPPAEEPNFAARNAACIAAADATRIGSSFAVERVAPAQRSAVDAWWARDPVHGQPWLCCDARGALVAGVGSARRLGTDLALALQASWTACSPYVRWLDADGHYPPLYFRDEAPAVSYAARFARFLHIAPEGASPRGAPGGALAEAAVIYDAWLRYEWAALSAVGAAGAYPPIASILHIHVGAYAAVRGVPERDAGEDFHLLAKLSKVGAIGGPLQAMVCLAARTEVRAPVGTAAGINALLLGESPPALFTHPEAFRALGYVLHATGAHQRASLPDPANAGPVPSWEDARAPFAPAKGAWPDERPLPPPNPAALLRTLLALGLPSRLASFVAVALEEAAAPLPTGYFCGDAPAAQEAFGKPKALAKSHFVAWFDALKQRRFLRAWSGTLPPMSGPEACARAQAELGPNFAAIWRQGLPECQRSGVAYPRTMSL